MLKALMKVQLAVFASIFSGQARAKKKQSVGKTVAFSLLMVYAFGSLMFLFYHIFDTLAAPFSMAGIEWFYFTVLWLMAFAIMFIGSVFTAKAQLFEAKDNERLLAMPIPAGVILLSRMLTLYLLNLLLGLLAIIPASIVWGIRAGFSAVGVVSILVLTLTMPLFAMAVSCLIAWLVSLIASRVEKKNLVTMVFSVLFLGVYFVFCARMNVYITRLAENGALLAGKLGAVKPLFWLGDAVAHGSALSLLLSVLVTALPMVIVYALLSRSFTKVVTTEHAGKKKVYRREALAVTSPRKALLRRELTHLGSSAGYMLNAGLGLLFMLAGGVVLLVKGGVLMEAVGRLGLTQEQLMLAGAIACCALLSTVVFTAPSPSMEGKNYWILRAMPITTKEILNTKLQMAELLTAIPAAFLVVCIAIVLKLSVPQTLLLLVSALAYLEMTACLGLVFGLRYAKLDWINDTQAVKQSIAVLFSMFGDMALVVAIALPYFLFLMGSFSPAAYLMIWTAVLIAAAALLRRRIFTKGVERYEELA